MRLAIFYHAKSVGLWWGNTRASIAAEAAIFIPILFMMLVAIYDIGTALLINQKAINASQMTADLIAREISVNDAQIEDAMSAARQAMMPLNMTNFGIAVASVAYNEDDEPEIIWQETDGVADEFDVDDAPIQGTIGLGGEGDGMVVVMVVYDYDPVFSGSFMPSILMREVSYTRGRRLPVVTRVE